MRLMSGEHCEHDSQVRAELYAAILATTSDGVWVFDRDGRILDVSDAYCQMSGYTREELLAMRIPQLDATMSEARVAEQIRRCIDSGFVRFESQHRARDGSLFDVEISASYSSEQDRFVLFARDISERRRSEQDARLRSEQYQSMLATTSDGFCLLGLGGRILDVNDAYCRMTGYSRAELLGIQVQELDSALTEAQLAEVSERVHDDGFCRFETRHRAKDGRAFDAEVSISHCLEQDLFVHFVRDISERKRAEAELADMKELLDRSQELSKVGGWEWDVAAGEGAWTDEVYRIYGVDKGSYDPADPLAEAFAPYDEQSAELIETAFQRAVREGEPYDLELGLVRPDGKRIVVRTIAEPVRENGRVVRLRGYIADVTELRRAEAEQRRLAAVVESSADAIMSADRAGRFTSWNQGAEWLYGYSAEEVIGRPISVLTPNDLQDEQAALIERMLRAESIALVETRRRRRDGSLVDVSIGGSVVRDSSGAVIGTCAIHRDMTEPRRIREALRRSEELFRGAFENSPIGMMMTSREGTFERVNDAFARMLGYEDPSELVGVHFTSITHPDDRAAGLEAVRMMFEQGVPCSTEKRYLRRDGSIVHVLLGSIAIEGSEGRPSVLFTQVEDITERKRAEEELRHERDFIDATLDVAGALILVLDRDWRIVRFNRQSELLSGYGEAEVLGRHYDFLVPEAEREAVHTKMDETAARRPTSQVNRWITKDGRLRLIRWSNAVLVDHAGHPTHFIGTGIDITEQDQAEQARERLATIVDASQDAIISLTAEGVIDSWNPGAERLYGYSAREAIGEHVAMLRAREEQPGRDEMLVHILRGNSVDQFEVRDRCRDGTVIDVSISGSPILEADGSVVGVARTARDITERKHLERQLKFYADHDPLTGLFNRRRFGEELSQQIAQGARYGQTTGLLVGDIDNFKYVNDSLGHKAGDEFIQRIARALEGRLRDSDVLARLGGDEFAILLPRTDRDSAVLVAESLRQAVHDHQLAIDTHSLRATISFGVTVIDGVQVAPDDALAIADLAMYEAKQHGRDRVATAQPGTDRERAEKILHWSERVHTALREQRFQLYAQPIVDLLTDETRRYELLLRLREDDGIVLPAKFIHIAERQGLIGEVDRWVVGQAMKVIAAHPDPEATFAVNLSGASMSDPSLLEFIEKSIAEQQIEPARLIFEVTETAAIADIDAARAFVQRLHDIGCAVALDDFGSGFGSFTYLKYLPIDYLKIDGDFIRQLPGSLEDRLLVKAIVDVARGLGKRTIAEHAGSEETIELLRAYGVDYAQGFHLGAPEPVTSAPTRR